MLFAYEHISLAAHHSLGAEPVNSTQTSLETFLDYIRSSIYPDSDGSLRLGILFCQEWRGNLCSGIGSDGQVWGFRTVNSYTVREDELLKPFEHRGVDFQIRQASLGLQQFGAVLLHRRSSNGEVVRRLDLCLPPQWCACVTKLMHQDLRSVSHCKETFLRDLAQEVAKRREMAASSAILGGFH